MRMVGAVASCTVKGPGTPARGYPVGCKPRRREGTGKVCGSAGRGRTRNGKEVTVSCKLEEGWLVRLPAAH